MLIEIAIHTYFYQHRLTFMLSSLLQQQGDVPSILVNISHTYEKEGNPTTREVCDFFRDKGLNITETVMLMQDFQNRSMARTVQLRNTKSDFILFADSDMVYDPLFFSDLKYQLETNLKDEKRCMAADRVSLDIKYCTDIFNNDSNQYPLVVENVAELVSKWPVYYISGRKRGAGYFQLGNVKFIRERNLEYGIANQDGLRKYIGDRYFRRNLGGIAPIEVKPQYHLNHSRTQEVFQR